MNIKQVIKEVFSNIKKDWYLPVTEYQVYSEQEQVVGVWTDGKPLYRKTLTNVPLGTVVATDVDTLVNVNNVCSYNGSLFSWGGGNALNSGLNLEKSGSQYTLVANSPTSYVYGDVGIFTIEYTKTTDTPTTKKVPFEPLIEYSTDEKMIGYWVDGKPLYRKTIRVDNVPVNSETALDHNIQNVDLIWFKKDASWMYDTLEQGTWALGAGNSNVSYHFFDVWANRTKYSIDLRGFTAGRVSYAYITFEYTKTTD